MYTSAVIGTKSCLVHTVLQFFCPCFKFRACVGHMLKPNGSGYQQYLLAVLSAIRAVGMIGVPQLFGERVLGVVRGRERPCIGWPADRPV